MDGLYFLDFLEHLTGKAQVEDDFNAMSHHLNHRLRGHHLAAVHA